MKDLRPSTLARAIRWTLGWEDSLEKGMATHSSILGASLVAQMVKNLPEMWDSGSVPGSETASGEGNEYPLQYSCLETPMDRGAWGLQSIESQRAGHN